MKFNIGIAFSNLENNLGPVQYTGVAVKQSKIDDLIFFTKEQLKEKFDKAENYFTVNALENELEKNRTYFKTYTVEKNEDLNEIQNKASY